jgi:gamma-glutamylputrescine oxidase
MLTDLAPGPIPLSEACTRDRARGELKAEVCIIGGGITGIAAAYTLSKRQIECVVLEAARIGAGGTGASGGQLLVGTAPDTRELERKYGFDTTQFLWDISIEGLGKTKALAQTDGAPCHFKAGHLSVAETPRELDALRARTEYRAVRLNYKSERMLSGAELQDHIHSPIYRSGVFDPNESYLDPGAFVSNLAQAAERQGAILYEGSPVLSVDKKLAHQEIEWMNLMGNVA